MSSGNSPESHDAAYSDDRPIVTIRKATDDERREKSPPVVLGGPRVRVPKYVLVNPETDRLYTIFGIPAGGDTRAEAVFWTERTASKNGLLYVPPTGWENVEGALKDA